MGSSPLARGTLAIDLLNGTALGLIPARAGNTGRDGAIPGRRRAHPRSRGEHHVCFAVDKPNPGSSPLARGTHKLQPVQRAHVGLIPARAGNTGSAGSGAALWGAHPRSRGEHQIQGGEGCARLGSSPLARGTPTGDILGLPAVGLIPARAGNTPSENRLVSYRRAHPRSRREHRLLCRRSLRRLGLIPARAGNTRLALQRGTH